MPLTPGRVSSGMWVYKFFLPMRVSRQDTDRIVFKDVPATIEQNEYYEPFLAKTQMCKFYAMGYRDLLL